ncbi:unnamed protein product [Ranitomeya imitator]|uniref:Uncharacterized protein n=1 Tax=Ranitomeya imitator TaxID=111125 RepID=A0ABN9LZF8_9NEOB|nr:unnamed protein product [Ranitomeya imitator]
MPELDSDVMDVPFLLRPVDSLEGDPCPPPELDSDEMDVPFLLRPVDSREGDPCPPPELDSDEMDVPFLLRPVDSREGDPCPEPDHTGSVSDRIGNEEVVDERQKPHGYQGRRIVQASIIESPHVKGVPLLPHGVPNCQQEVSNVARFLFFVNPKSVTLEYLVKPNKVNNFFQQLGKLHLSSQTSLKMLKHIRRFTIYQMRATKLRLENPQLYKACEVFMNFTTDLQKSLYKGACRESVSKRYDLLMKPSKSPKDCQIILEEARPTFLASVEAVTDGGSEVDRREVVLYLEALLILKHLQRPGVVRNMTVSEWNERIHHTYQGRRKTIVGVKTHKCSTSQVATFVLSEKEELWFNAYAEYVRPVFTAGRKIITNFFVTCTGKVINNPSMSLRRYHSSYNLPNITSHLVRRICETWTLSQYTDCEKRLFARYLAHTNDVAERVYREKTLTDMCRAQELVFNAGNREDAKIMSPVMASTSELDNEVVDLTEKNCPKFSKCQGLFQKSFPRLLEVSSVHLQRFPRLEV